MKRVLNFLVSTACILLILAGCAKGPDRDIESRIFVSPNRLELYVGDGYIITASPTLASYNWETSDALIATVSESGEVTGTGVGTAIITVSDNDARKEIPVTVILPTADNIIGRPGVYRAAVELEINNERIKAVKITRMDTGDSQITPINFQKGNFTSFYEGLAEGRYLFNVTCTDRHDLESEPVELFIQVYGDQYKTMMQENPPFSGVLIIEPGTDGAPKPGVAAALLLTIEPVEGGFFTYTKIDGNEELMMLSGNDLRVTDVDPSKPMGITARYLPDPRSIDFFDITFDAIPKIRKNRENIITMVNYDFGGVNMAFFSARTNTTTAQFAYRTDLDDVNTGAHLPIFEGAPNWNLGGLAAGNWFNYTVYVEDAGNYLFNCEAAANGTAERSANGSISVNGANEIAFQFSGTGSWTTYFWHWPSNNLPAPRPTNPEDPFSIALTQGWNTIRWTVGNPANCNLRKFSLTWVD